MFDLILYQPEIPPNTGNIIRVCANTGTTLHLIHPLGFKLDDRKLRRAGLDYHEFAALHEYPTLEDCINSFGPGRRIFALSTKGGRCYADVAYQPRDVFLFGPETRGLPMTILDAWSPDQCLRIPMQPANRSLNLSNAAAVVLFEAWRQQGFAGGS